MSLAHLFCADRHNAAKTASSCTGGFRLALQWFRQGVPRNAELRSAHLFGWHNQNLKPAVSPALLLQYPV
eukprot:8787151-Prorocentrum_lima.AAC.1